MAAHLDLSPDEFRARYVISANGWEFISTPTHRPRCFLNHRDECSVYHYRPKACRTYPDWPEIWESEEALQSEARGCPGLARAIDAVGQ